VSTEVEKFALAKFLMHMSWGDARELGVRKLSVYRKKNARGLPGCQEMYGTLNVQGWDSTVRGASGNVVFQNAATIWTVDTACYGPLSAMSWTRPGVVPG
jgi:hypothetical protein